MKNIKIRADVFNNIIVALNAILLITLLNIYGFPKINISLFGILLAAQIIFRLYPVPLLRSSFLSLAFLPFIIIFLSDGYLSAAIFVVVSIIIADGLFKRKGLINSLRSGSQFSFALLVSGLIYVLLGGISGAEAIKVDNYLNLAIFLFIYHVIQLVFFYVVLMLSKRIEISELFFVVKWETIVYITYSFGGLILLWTYYNKGIAILFYIAPFLFLAGLVSRQLLKNAILSEELDKIVNIGALLASDLNIRNTMDQTEKLLRRVVEYKNFYLALCDKVNNQLHIIYDSRKGLLEQPVVISLKKGLAGKVYREGKPIIVKDTTRIKDRVEMEEAMLSELIVPVRFGEEIVGIIDLEHPDAYHFTSRDLAMLIYMVNYVAIAIHFYHMIQPLSKISHEARVFMDELTSTLQEISAGSQEISSTLGQMTQEMNNQSEMLMQEALSVDAVYSTSQSIAKHSSLADEKNTVANEIIDTNRADIERTAQSLLEAQEIIQSIASEVKGFQTSFEKIEEFINIIKGIAHQTALLSLNASIEASKAGEYGKGFSVVADEISRLAEESSRSSEEIKESSRQIREQLEQLIGQAFRGEEKARGAKMVTERFYEALSRVLDATSESNQIVNEIAQKTEEQRNEIARITDNTGELDKINRKNVENTQNIASSMQQQSASLQNIHQKASELEGLIETINQLINQLSGRTEIEI